MLRSGWTCIQVHGYLPASAFYNRCAGKGPLFLVQRRGSNKRVFGGFTSLKYVWASGRPGENGGPQYIDSSASKKHFLYRVEPKDAKKVSFVDKCCDRTVYYGHPARHLCFRDNMCCQNGQCWFQTGGSYSRQEEGNDFFTGASSHSVRCPSPFTSWCTCGISFTGVYALCCLILVFHTVSAFYCGPQRSKANSVQRHMMS